MKIRLSAPWCTPETEFRNGDFLFSSRIALTEADALLAWWEPVASLYEFAGPKLFYCAEPYDVPSVWKESRWQNCLKQLHPDEIVRPGHPNPERRIMHDTHHVSLSMSRAEDRIERAVAIVSNNGGSCSRRWDEMELRNRLVTNSHVDLFGKESAWGDFRRRWFFPPATPRNYCGEIAGTWANDTILRLCEQYKVAVCLENSCEPYYFSEKFVNAVRSGCIPVYHAHPTVAGGILKNAKWIDPAHHGFDAERTLRYALTEDLAEYHRINEAWLFSEEVAATESSRIRIQIATILRQQNCRAQ